METTNIVTERPILITQNPTSEYMLLFRGSHWDKGLSAEELQQVMGKVSAWFERLQQQGKMKGARPLGDEGRTVSGKNGKTVADGPFAESKEAVGGYLVVLVDNLDEAVAIAKTCPTLEYGTKIEVRPVLDECPKFKRANEERALATA